MKRVKYDEIFIAHYVQRIAPNPKFAELFKKQEAVFKADRSSAKLADHHLNWGMQGKRAFSITKDIRVVYKETDDVFLFLDIGTYQQVYKGVD